MSCLYPVKMYRLFARNPDSGKRICVHNLKDARGKEVLEQFYRPCQQCIECRLKKSRYIATRCVHTASIYPENSFLTLTYSDEQLPPNLSLDTRVMQLFWKKLRKSIEPKKIKYYACGEYGDGKGSREINPHYHAVLFNHDFPDKKIYKKTSNGDTLYTSDTLTDMWGYGHAVIGDVTFESAAYVARYTMKKVYGDDAEDHYQGRMPEKSWCSNGLGEEWFEKWRDDIYPSDQLVLRGGKICTPPPYYDQLLLKHDPDLYNEVMEARQLKIIPENNNSDLQRFWLDGKPVTQSASEVVRRAALRVGSLDKER